MTFNSGHEYSISSFYQVFEELVVTCLVLHDEKIEETQKRVDGIL